MLAARVALLAFTLAARVSRSRPGSGMLISVVHGPFGGNPMSRFVALTALALLLIAPIGAQARETTHNFSVKDAAESELGQAKLYDVPFYMKGQKHPRVNKVVFEVSTEQSTRGAFRSDDDSCQVAFLSAIRELQNTAREKGGNAIVDIVSVTWNKETESSDEYRCVAGTFVVHVGLKGKIVKIAK